MSLRSYSDHLVESFGFLSRNDLESCHNSNQVARYTFNSKVKTLAKRPLAMKMAWGSRPVLSDLTRESRDAEFLLSQWNQLENLLTPSVQVTRIDSRGARTFGDEFFTATAPALTPFRDYWTGATLLLHDLPTVPNARDTFFQLFNNIGYLHCKYVSQLAPPLSFFTRHFADNLGALGQILCSEMDLIGEQDLTNIRDVLLTPTRCGAAQRIFVFMHGNKHTGTLIRSVHQMALVTHLPIQARVIVKVMRRYHNWQLSGSHRRWFDTEFRRPHTNRHNRTQIMGHVEGQCTTLKVVPMSADPIIPTYLQPFHDY
ncbi:hypothetical protein AAVH_38183 [Aphelenchoides avenae]|nr:hypothetical protein AAVH_38183 [Aphelenchus avenae]